MKGPNTRFHPTNMAMHISEHGRRCSLTAKQSVPFSVLHTVRFTQSESHSPSHTVRVMQSESYSSNHTVRVIQSRTGPWRVVRTVSYGPCHVVRAGLSVLPGHQVRVSRLSPGGTVRVTHPLPALHIPAAPCSCGARPGDQLSSAPSDSVWPATR